MLTDELYIKELERKIETVKKVVDNKISYYSLMLNTAKKGGNGFDVLYNQGAIAALNKIKEML